MKTELKTKWFKSSMELADFVNGNKITKENIQSITSIKDLFIIYYWEIEI
jgi:hypothetical protein